MKFATKAYNISQHTLCMLLYTLGVKKSKVKIQICYKL